MGSDRNEHQDKSPAQIFVTLYEKSGFTTEQLFQTWVGYNSKRQNGFNARKAIAHLLKHPEMFPIEIVGYFASIGLELYNKEYLKELKNGEKI